MSQSCKMGQQSTTHPNLPQRNPIWIALALLSLLISPHAHAQTSISALSIPLILPSAVVFDPQGNLYIAETGNNVIRKVDPLGHITTIAGTATQGFSGDNGPATSAQLDSPQGLALSGNLIYIADTHNHRIRKLDLTTNIITTIAGTTPGFSGDSGPATSAHLNLPTAITFDTNQNLYVADTANHRIRRIDAATGTITTIAGNGTQGFSGDSGLATSASIDSPTGLAVDSLNNLYLADTHNHRIRKIAATTNIITTIAGTGTLGQSGDAALATSAQLALPHGLTIDPQGNVYLADTANHRIRRIDATTGIITTIAGIGTQGYSGDTGPATTANLDSPRAATFSPTQLTIADTNNQRVRQLTTSQTITTIAGLGNTTPGTLTLTAPSVIAYGTGQLTATLNTATAATGSITFIDTHAALTTTLAAIPLTTNSATLITTTLPTGVHNITATYPGDLTHTNAQSPTFTLTITQAPTLTTLLLPTSPATLPATLTAQVASTTTGIPTGTLSLLDANTSIATTTLTTTGTATFIIPTLAPGNHTLTAAYTGDPNFQSSITTPATLTITTPITTPADFTLTATGPTSQTITSGTAAIFTFTAPTQGNLSSPIILSATGLPSRATATFNPTIIPPGAISPSFTLTITTLKLASIPTNKLIPTLATLLLPFLCLKSRRRKNRRTPRLRALYSIALISLITLTTVACGDRVNTANSEATQPQTYNITITATATTPTGSPLTHSATITLTLQ
jgi:Bacterial Ig-like domain (group 3)/NHL repeat